MVRGRLEKEEGRELRFEGHKSEGGGLLNSDLGRRSAVDSRTLD